MSTSGKSWKLEYMLVRFPKTYIVPGYMILNRGQCRPNLIKSMSFKTGPGT